MHKEQPDFSCPSFRAWVIGTAVIGSVFGLAILGMALLGAAGVTLTGPAAPILEVSAQSR
jgi:hypothetical protein